MNSSKQMPIGPSLDHVKFLETLINSIPDVVYIYNIVDQINVYSNDGILKVLGYSAEELQGMGQRMLQLLMHPDDFSAYQSKTKPAYALLGDNEFLINQFRMKHQDGSWRWLESNETVYERTLDRAPCKIFGVIHDITKKKAAEATLLQSNALLTQAQQLTYSGHYVLDITTGLWSSSETLNAIFGIDGSYLRSVEGLFSQSCSEGTPAI
jgi:PAS domain S-box-containing protein